MEHFKIYILLDGSTDENLLKSISFAREDMRGNIMTLLKENINQNYSVQPTKEV